MLAGAQPEGKGPLERAWPGGTGQMDGCSKGALSGESLGSSVSWQTAQPPVLTVK